MLSRAIVRDLYSRDESAAMLAYITMAMVAAPMMAPVLGGLLTDLAGWRSVFLAGVGRRRADPRGRARGLAETAPGIGRAPGARSPLRSFRQLLRSPPFLGYALQGAFSIAVFYAFLAAAPYLMVKVLRPPGQRVRPDVDPGLRRVHARQLRRGTLLGPDRQRSDDPARAAWARWPARCSCWGLLLAGWWSPWALFLPTSLAAFAQGVAMPNSQAAFVSVDPQAAGAASGLGGFLQMGIAAAGGAGGGLAAGRHALADGDRDDAVRRGCPHRGAGGDPPCVGRTGRP